MPDAGKRHFVLSMFAFPHLEDAFPWLWLPTTLGLYQMVLEYSDFVEREMLIQ